MFCRNCGKQINDEAVLCVNCGTLINGAVFNCLTVPPAPVPTVAGNVPNKNRLAIVGFILSFFGVIGWVFSLGGLVLSIIGLVQSRKLKNGKGFGIAGIVISVVAFFVHGVIMALLMPIIARLAMVPLLFIILLLLA